MRLSDMDSQMPAVPLLSFDTDCILSAEEDFQNMDSFAGDSSADIGSFETPIQDIGLLAVDNNRVGKVHNLEVSSLELDSSPVPYSLAVNDKKDSSYASVSD